MRPEALHLASIFQREAPPPRALSYPAELRELREEVSELRAENAALRREMAGGGRFDEIGRLGIVGQEARVLSCLLANPGVTVPQERLFLVARIEGLSADAHLRGVISRLRSKIEARGIAGRDAISSVRATGYFISREDCQKFPASLSGKASGGQHVSRSL